MPNATTKKKSAAKYPRHAGGRPRVLADDDPTRRPKVDAFVLRVEDGDRDLFMTARDLDERRSTNEWMLWVLRAYSRDVVARAAKAQKKRAG